MKRQVVITALASLALVCSSVLSGTQINANAMDVDSSQLTKQAIAQVDPAIADGDWYSTIQEEIRQSEYNVSWQDQTYLESLPSAYQAPNRVQNLRTYFTDQGIKVIPREFEGKTPPWEWGLSLSGYGYVGDVKSVAEATLVNEANRVEYQRNTITEWYVNDERGLEQGFTLQSPPRSTTQNPQSEIALNLALSGNLTPQLTTNGTAVEFTTPGGVGVLHYSDLVVYDATGHALPAHIELTSPSKGNVAEIRVVIDAAGAVYPITVDPLASSPAWTAESDQADAKFGSSVSTAGDVNGDGFSDVIVGAPTYDNGQTDEGQAFVYHGSSTGLSASAVWTAESDQAYANFGISVGTAGDVNGDGYGDVIVGADLYSNDQMYEGRAYVYQGSSTGLNASPNWTAESNQDSACFGYSVGTAGDVNGDGYSDVIVGAYLYSNGQTNEGRAYVYNGSASGLSATADWAAESNQDVACFGNSVGTAGDVNGDGYSDVIVGANFYDNGQTEEGRAYVYHGSASGLSATADWTAESDQAYANFGNSVDTAGDVNGDGYSDVIVGAKYYDNGQTNEGRAYVYHGGASGLSTSANWTAESDQLYADFGRSVGTAGDVNGDGYSDVIVGANYYDNGQTDEGRAYVYHGSATGLGASPAWTAESNQDNAYYAVSVGTAGDVNGDGYSDVIVGAYYYDNGQTNEGRAYVYHGAPAGLSASVAWTVDGDQLGARLGNSVGTAGDVNGDGYSDVIIGALEYDNGQINEGRAYVFHGSATGLSTTPDWMAESDQAGAQFGKSVGTAGDVNGDGYSDVIVGAEGYNNGQTGEGRAYVYHGGATGLTTSSAWTAESNQVNAHFGFSVGTAGDVNGDGYSDVIVGAWGFDNDQTDEGRAYVYHGSATGLITNPAWTAESDQVNAQFGVSVGTAGDVNGDGYSDVIIGADHYDNDQTNEGRAYVYHGSSVGLETDTAWTAESDQAEALFGISVGTAGDVNGDGYSDVIVGANYYDNGQADEGRAFVYHGSSTGLNTSPIWTAESNQTSAYFGNSVGTAGDVNGDGYSDVIIGAYRYDSGEDNEGRAFVYHGSPTGLAASAAWTAESNQNAAWFGISVGTAGDVNGDGYSDVIVGAVYYVTSYSMEGRASVYYGNTGDGLHLLPRQLRSDGSAPITKLGLSDSKTAFQLSLMGRMPLGRELVKLQWQAAPLGTEFDDAGALNGTSAAWTDVLTTGVTITEDIADLDPGTPYHWRVRLLYKPGNALGQPAGRWVTIPVNGWNETDLRTANEPPLADAGPDQIVDTLTVVTLDGSLSSDPDGNLPLTYLWTQTGGTTVTLSDSTVVNPTFTAPGDPAVLTFALIVTDSLGLADPTPDEVIITVNNQPPLADTGPDQSVYTLATVTLDGSNSSDPDGDLPLIYAWAQTGGTTVTLSDPTVVNPTFTAPGNPATLTFSLTVTDSLGLADPTPDEVIITVANHPPVTDAGPDQIVDTLATVMLDGSNSSDPDGDLPLTYAWAQTGGTTVTLNDPTVVNPTFTAPSDPATLTFSLTVTDCLGLPDPTPDEVIITVNNQPPLADAGSDQMVFRLSLVTLSGSLSSDPDGHLPLTYLWIQTGGENVTLSDPMAANPTFISPANAGTLTFTLMVTDSLGMSALVADQVEIMVFFYSNFLPLIIK